MRRRSSSCSVRNLCRSSSAENSSSASGLTRPSWASARSAARSRFCCSSRSYGAGSRRSGSPSSGSSAPRRHRRDRLVGPVLGDQGVGVEAELLEGPLLQLLDAHPLLGAGHLVAVHGVDQLVELAPSVAQPLPGLAQLLLPPAPALLDPRPLGVGRQLDGVLQPASTTATPRADASATRPSRSSRSRRATASARASRSACAARRRARRHGRAAPGRAPRPCAARAGPPSPRARGAGRLGELARGRAVSGSSSGASCARSEPSPRARPARRRLAVAGLLARR